MTAIEYSRPRLASYQLAILNSEARYTITEAATKTGKTSSHIIWLFEQAMHGSKGKNYWWVAPVFNQAEIAFVRMQAYVSKERFFKVNQTKLTLTLPNGAVIFFKSAEKPDNLYGEDVYAAVCDEFTRMREEAWFALRSTLTATNAKCKFIGNVKGKKNWGYKLGQRAKSGEPGYEYHKITAYDAVEAGILTLFEIEQAKRDLPDYVFRELYLAEPNDDASNPFGLTHIKQCSYPLSTLPVKCYGIDLAKSVDWTVIIGLDVNGNCCYFDRFQKDWKQTKETILRLPNVPMMIDSTGVGDSIVEDLQHDRSNIEGFKYSQTSKQQLMEGLAIAIQQRKITFPEGSITSELEQFEYSFSQTGVKYTAPQGVHDDCVNALALAWRKYLQSAGSGKYLIGRA